MLEGTFACLKLPRITTSAECRGAARKNGGWHSKWGTLIGKEECSGNDGGNSVQPLPQAQWDRATRGVLESDDGFLCLLKADSASWPRENPPYGVNPSLLSFCLGSSGNSGGRSRISPTPASSPPDVNVRTRVRAETSDCARTSGEGAPDLRPAFRLREGLKESHCPEIIPSAPSPQKSYHRLSFL